jgi:hypothetical protein
MFIISVTVDIIQPCFLVLSIDSIIVSLWFLVMYVNWKFYILTQELRCLDYRTCKVNSESTPVMDDCCVLYESLEKNNSRRECHIATDIVASNDSFGGIMKFLLAFGFLTLQGSQPALAVSDIASGLQSIPYLGDLGDISTGFASVRIISL